jgi:hypothetical protein
VNIGMTLVEVESSALKQKVRRQVKQAMSLTPVGRQLCVTFPLPRKWIESFPYDAIVVSEVLGKPETRAEPNEWVFSVNISIRLCKAVADQRVVSGEIGVLIFRRSGEMAYTRRATMAQEKLDKAILPVLNPVFTRDVANNVWHLPSEGHVSRIRNRLQSLYTWPDERTLLVSSESQRSLAWKRLNLDDDLVGVPTKSSYRWSADQLEMLGSDQV